MNGTAIVLSAEQRAAILTPGNLLVRAGAGSGKTEVLARRFIALITGEVDARPPLLPTQVAAITFTEKAADDMRERIADVLDERLSQYAAGAGRAHLLRARAMLPLARISTIHAFCARMLRENALEAALDPDFAVLDEYESQTFLERLCKQGLLDAVRQSDQGACCLTRARGLDSGTRREGALQIVMRILDELARLGRTPQWLHHITRDTAARMQAEADRVTLVAQELSRRLDELLASDLSPRAQQTITPLLGRQDEYRRRILAIQATIEPQALEFLHDVCECIPSAQGKVKDCVRAINQIVHRTDSHFGLSGELLSLYGACRAAPRAREIAAAIHTLAGKVEAAKLDQGVVTFDDLLRRTRELLEGSTAARRRYQSMLRALLVDEFQDTDAVQHQIIARLSEPASGLPAPELFIVGDEKQSIYRFRGAEVAGFARMGERPQASIRTLPLLGNRRSSSSIVAFVNALGGALMRSQIQPPPSYWVEWSAAHALSALRTSEQDCPVEIITAIQERPPETAAVTSGQMSRASAGFKLNAGRKRMLEGLAIATRIEQLVGRAIITDSSGTPRPVRHGDIAILLRSFTDVTIYEAALLDARIPCYTVKGRGFFACAEVLDLIELLSVLDNPADSLALAAVLRSPFFALSDDCLAEIALHRERANESAEASPPKPLAATFAAAAPDFSWLGAERDDAVHAARILDELIKLRARGSISAVVEHALEATSYEAVMLGLRQGRQRVANLRKLVELARDFESRQLFSFHDFVVHLRRLAVLEPYEPPAQTLAEDEDVVRLMTVHQAKGLEFPVVFVADSGRKPEGERRNPVVDPENGLLMCDTVGSGMDEIPNYLLEQFRQRSNAEQQAESLRLLYVALTRARDRLIVSEGATLQGWARQIRHFIGEDVFARFVESGAPQELIKHDGTTIRLLRPESTAAQQQIQAPADTNHEEDLAALVQRRLNFQPPPATELVISPTALADFDRCPRQFHFRHQLKLPEHELAQAGSGFASTSAMGTVAHAVLERLPAESIDPGAITALVDLIGLPARLDARQRSRIVADLARYRANFAANPPSAREVGFCFHLGDTFFVRGQIDALVEDGARIIVRDYKYAEAADHGRLYQVQMEAYALAAAEAYRRSRIEAEIVFLKDHCVTVAVALPSLQQMRMHLLSLARKVVAAQSSGNYDRKPADANACRRLNCGFVARCWNASIGNLR